MPIGVFLVMVAFTLAMAGVMVFAGLRARRRGALVGALPASYLANAEDGYRQFEGRVEAIDRRAVHAPLTRVPCVWYHATVQELRTQPGERSEMAWTEVFDETSDTPFFVRDDGGVAVVQPYLADVFPTDKSGWYGSTREPEDRNPARVPPTENPFGMVETAGGAKRFKYFEERIYDGDPLLVQGHFSRHALADDDEDDDFADEAEGELDEQDKLIAALLERARERTKAVISRGPIQHPFIVTTTAKAAHVEMSKQGGAAAVTIAAVPLALTALLLWTRSG